MLITAGADGEAVRKAMKKRRRKQAFSCVSSDACRLRGTPAGDFFIALSEQKFFGVLRTFFSKKVLSGVRGGAPYMPTGVRGGAPYILIGARGGASQIPIAALQRAYEPFAYAVRY